jgi:hypothetical protein
LCYREQVKTDEVNVIGVFFHPVFPIEFSSEFLDLLLDVFQLRRRNREDEPRKLASVDPGGENGADGFPEVGAMQAAIHVGRHFIATRKQRLALLEFAIRIPLKKLQADEKLETFPRLLRRYLVPQSLGDPSRIFLKIFRDNKLSDNRMVPV